MNYEDMCDLKLNLAVAKALGLSAFKQESNCGTPMYRTEIGIVRPNKTDWVDYCNNPSDAWPIIIENEICLDPRRTIKKLPWMASVGDQVYSTDKNPLRAAMICFLKMKDAEK